MASSYSHATPVTVSYPALLAGDIPLSTLESAFGPSSLGILVVTDLPASFPQLRKSVLSYSSILANLQAEELAKLEVPDAKYLVGWSRGREKLENGRPDRLKGSYYVNCAFYKDPSLQGAEPQGYEGFEEYTMGNVWPEEKRGLEGFREATQSLCALVIDVAKLVAKACDRFGMLNRCATECIY